MNNIGSVTKITSNPYKTNFTLEARPDGKLAAALILNKIIIPSNFRACLPQDTYCWQERVDVGERFKGNGFATALLYFGGEVLRKNGFGGELRMFVDYNHNGFNNYLSHQPIIFESGVTYFWRL